MQRIDDRHVPIHGDRNQIPNRHTARDNDQEESQHTPQMESAQFRSQIERHVIRQRDPNQHIGHGQRQHEPIGQDQTQPSTQPDGQNGQSVAAENEDHQADVDGRPEQHIVGDLIGSIVVRPDGAHVGYLVVFVETFYRVFGEREWFDFLHRQDGGVH